MTKSKPNDYICNKPVYISTHLENSADASNPQRVIGDRIVASVLWGKKTYEISLKVQVSDQDADIACLANDQLEQHVNALALSIFKNSQVCHGTKIKIDQKGKLTTSINSAETEISTPASSAFKKYIVNTMLTQKQKGEITIEPSAETRDLTKDPDLQINIDKRTEPTQIGPLENTNPLFLNGSFENPVISLLEDKNYVSDNDFKLFAEDAKRNECFAKEASTNGKTPESDYRLTISPKSENTKRLLNNETKDINYDHRLIRNSVFNHTGYYNQEENKAVFIDDAIATRNGSSKANLARAVLKESGESVVYTGKIDTEEKAKDSLKQIIKTEYALLKKDAKKSKLKEKNGEFELPFLTNALLSASWVNYLRNKNANESEMLKKEQAVLENLNDTYLTVNVDNQEIQVKLKPFFVNTGLNGFMDLPNCINGQKHSDELSEKGEASFIKFAEEEIEDLEKEEDKKRAKEALEALKNADKTPDLNLRSLQKLINRAFICNLLGIAMIAHCKSSIDRTTIAIGLISAVNQVMDSGNVKAFEKDGVCTPHAILNNSEYGNAFKNQVVSNMIIGHYFVKMARGKPGFKWSGSEILALLKTPETEELIEKLKESYFRPSNLEKISNCAKQKFSKIKTTLEHRFDLKTKNIKPQTNKKKEPTQPKKHVSFIPEDNQI